MWDNEMRHEPVVASSLPQQKQGWGNQGGNGGHSQGGRYGSFENRGSRGGRFGGDGGSFNRFGGGRSGSGSGSFGNNSRGSVVQSTPTDWELVKNLYEEHPDLASISEDQIQTFRKENEIHVVSGHTQISKPVMSFDQVTLSNGLTDVLRGEGFVSPTPIQGQTWPIALSGKNMIGVAETGSGKTLAFLVPMIEHIKAQTGLRFVNGPIGLIICPTRELAQQIKDQAYKFFPRVPIGVAYGGASRRSQLGQLERGVGAVVACPGRLNDFLESGNINLGQVSFLVLDEADRMLDMGFEPQIRKILGSLSEKRQTCMFSATWPQEVQALARDFIGTDVIHIRIGVTGLKACKTVFQNVHVVSGELQKTEMLTKILIELYSNGKGPVVKSIVFCETKVKADDLAWTVKRALQDHKIDYNVQAMHGDKQMDARTRILNEFKAGACPILIATDVASRGLDVDGVGVVINFDMANQIEDYVHRIGRTGRAGTSGIAHTFLTSDKGRIAKDLIGLLEQNGQAIPEELKALTYSSGRSGSGGSFSRFGGGGGGFRNRPYGNSGGGYNSNRGRQGGRSF